MKAVESGFLSNKKSALFPLHMFNEQQLIILSEYVSNETSHTPNGSDLRYYVDSASCPSVNVLHVNESCGSWRTSSGLAVSVSREEEVFLACAQFPKKHKQFTGREWKRRGVKPRMLRDKHRKTTRRGYGPRGRGWETTRIICGTAAGNI